MKLVSILWYGLALIESYQEFQITWITKANIQYQEWYQKYIYSLYWSVTTMTTVGYGDISATNEIEALFVSIVMIFMSCVFAYSINNIGIILQAIERDTQELTDNVTTIQRKNVNVQLKSRIRHYLYFLAEEQKDRNKEMEDKVLGKLSNKLREEVKKEVNSRILKKYMIFTKQFSSETINRIVSIMKEVLVSPNEIIFKENEVDDNALYFIENGIIEIQHTNEGLESTTVVIKTLGSNQLFGEISLFSGLTRTATARSVNLSTLYKISRQELIDVLKQNHEDFERFKMINEQMIFQKDYSSIGLECYTCHKQGHISARCPLTHLQRDRQFLSLRYNYSVYQIRGADIQRNRKKERFSIVKKSKIKEIKRMIFPDLSEFEDSSYDGTFMYENNEGEQFDSSSSQGSSVSINESKNITQQEVEFILDTSINYSKQKTMNDNELHADLYKHKDKESSFTLNIPTSKKRLTVKAVSDNIREEDEKIKTSNLEEKQISKLNKLVVTKLEQVAQSIESKWSQLENVINSQIDPIQIYRSQNKRQSEKQDAYFGERTIHYQNTYNKDEKDNTSSKQSMIQSTQEKDNEPINSSFNAEAKKQARKEKKRKTQTSPFSRNVSQLQQSFTLDKEDQRNSKVFRDKESALNYLDPKSQLQIPDKVSFNPIVEEQNFQPFTQNILSANTFKHYEKNHVDVMEFFDNQKEFSKFFPKNNISKVLEKMKDQSLNMKKSKLKAAIPKVQQSRVVEQKGPKAVRRLHLFLADDQIQNILTNFNPSTISYGIGQKGQNPKYPIRRN